MIPLLENILKWNNTTENAPDKAELVNIGFEKGKPFSINGKNLPRKEIIYKLNELGGEHGVGVFHLLEDRIVGLKVWGIYENPAAHFFVQAYYNTEQLL